jgi:CTP:phosphocholine cytidylyltransferase-like protein
MDKNYPNINIVIPMAGNGRAFKEAGYAFPKPLIDIGGKTMIEHVPKAGMILKFNFNFHRNLFRQLCHISFLHNDPTI